MPQKIVCIIQARRRSTRLPDKILKPLGGKPALGQTIARCMAIPSVSEVVCAGIDDAYEQPIFDVAQQCGATTFKGSETNVLSRYYYAAKEAKADWVIRVTSDCPLFDPDVAEQLIQLVTGEPGTDFGANARWPHGLDCELFRFELLEQAYAGASSPGELEHVTLWMKRNNTLKMKHNFPSTQEDLGKKYRWVLDYPEDYSFLSEIYDRLPPGEASYSWQSVMSILSAEPQLMAINQSAINAWHQENMRIHNSP